MRFRFKTTAFLWLMLLFAVCFGWAADRSLLQRKVNWMTQYEEFRQQEVKKLDEALQAYKSAHEKLVSERNAILDKLRNGESVKYTDFYPKAPKPRATVK